MRMMTAWSCRPASRPLRSLSSRLPQNPKPATRSSPRRSNSPRNCGLRQPWRDDFRGSGQARYRWRHEELGVDQEGRADPRRTRAARPRKGQRRRRPARPRAEGQGVRGNADFVGTAGSILEEIQAGLLARATAYRDANTVRIDTKEEFYAFFTAKNASKPRSTAALRSPIGTARVRSRRRSRRPQRSPFAASLSTARGRWPLHPHRGAQQAPRGLGEVLLILLQF